MILTNTHPTLQYGVEFCDADDVHPASNVEKMRRGESLTDLVRMI